jgi:hypothetical protein
MTPSGWPPTGASRVRRADTQDSASVALVRPGKLTQRRRPSSHARSRPGRAYEADVSISWPGPAAMRPARRRGVGEVPFRCDSRSSLRRGSARPKLLRSAPPAALTWQRRWLGASLTLHTSTSMELRGTGSGGSRARHGGKRSPATRRHTIAKACAWPSPVVGTGVDPVTFRLESARQFVPDRARNQAHQRHPQSMSRVSAGPGRDSDAPALSKLTMLPRVRRLRARTAGVPSLAKHPDRRCVEGAAAMLLVVIDPASSGPPGQQGQTDLERQHDTTEPRSSHPWILP